MIIYVPKEGGTYKVDDLALQLDSQDQEPLTGQQAIPNLSLVVLADENNHQLIQQIAVTAESNKRRVLCKSLIGSLLRLHGT